MKENKILLLFKIFLTMFKIGLFTFGGGYAMVAVFEGEFVSRKKWIEHEEFANLIAIAESTPGPIAINSATYIGYKVAGFWGSVFGTLGVVLPSFIIIFIISLVFEQFLQITIVAKAFKGIQACVAFLILSAGVKMFLKSKKDALSVIIFVVVNLLVIFFTLFSIKFSSVYYILAGAFVGVTVYLIGLANKKMKVKASVDDKTEVVSNLGETGEKEGE